MEAPAMLMEGATEQRVLLLVSDAEEASPQLHVLPDGANARSLLESSPVLLTLWRANASTGAHG